MKKFIKRLPCLLLALVIAVLPLMLAVSANASSDVLEGENINLPSTLEFGNFSFPVLDAVVKGTDYSFVIGIQYYSSSDIFGLYAFPSSAVSSVSLDAVGGLCLDFTSSTSVSCYEFVNDVWVYSSTEKTGSFTFKASSGCGLFRFSSSLDLSSVSPYIGTIRDNSRSSVGVLTVFSGVGSWLAGAVNNMVSMFWTAEGGLSVLGVLAVASLAIAFIVLLIYLLAGWMKFK